VSTNLTDPNDDYREIPDGARVFVTRGGPLQGRRGTVVSHEAKTLAYPPGTPVWVYQVRMDDPVFDHDEETSRRTIEWQDYEIAPLDPVSWLAELA